MENIDLCFKDRHPGWNKGSIAYHADDGKVFMGSGTGKGYHQIYEVVFDKIKKNTYINLVGNICSKLIC